MKSILTILLTILTITLFGQGAIKPYSVSATAWVKTPTIILDGDTAKTKELGDTLLTTEKWRILASSIKSGYDSSRLNLVNGYVYSYIGGEISDSFSLDGRYKLITDSSYNSMYAIVPITNTAISIPFTSEFDTASYFLYIYAWYNDTVDGDVIQVSNEISNIVKATTGFTCDVGVATGWLTYLAVDSMALTPVAGIIETDPFYKIDSLALNRSMRAFERDSGNYAWWKDTTQTTGAGIASRFDNSLKQNLLVNSAGLAGAINDETGTLKAVFSDSPEFTTKLTNTGSTISDNFKLSSKSWTTSYDSPETGIYSLTTYNGNIYAGSYPSGIIYKFDGNTWTTSFDSPESQIISLTTYNGSLYAGSYPSGIIYKFDGNTWTTSYDSPESPILSLTTYNGNLYAGTGNNGIIYKFDGNTWTTSYDSPEAYILSLTTYNGSLYAGSEANGIIYKFDNNAWTTSFDSPESQIISLTTYNGSLYAGSYPSGIIYKFDGNTWTTSYDSPESHIRSLTTYNGSLYAGSGANGIIYKYGEEICVLGDNGNTFTPINNLNNTWTGINYLTNKAYVGIEQAKVPGVLFTQTVNKTITNTTTETTLVGTGVGSTSLPALSLIAGKTVRMQLSGYLSCDAGDSTTINIKVGATTLVSSKVKIPVAMTNTEFIVDFTFTCRTTGATGTVIGQGSTTLFEGQAFTTSYSRALQMTSTATVNTTVINALNITYKFNAARATNSITVTNATLEILN